MESEVQVPKSEVWTEEKHVHFLNTMEASFVRTMLHPYPYHRHYLRLDRHLPDTSDSTLDSKPPTNRSRPKNKKHASASAPAPADSMSPRARRTRRRSSQRQNSSLEQVAPQLENERQGQGDACVVGDDDKEQRRDA